LATKDRIDISLVRYDMQTRTQSILVSQALPVNPTEFTWDPTMTRGLFSVTSSICAGIGAMTRHGLVDLSLAINVGDRVHRLDENLHTPGSADCSGQIKADLPAWSPDGSRIAFLASPADSSSHSGSCGLPMGGCSPTAGKRRAAVQVCGSSPSLLGGYNDLLSVGTLPWHGPLMARSSLSYTTLARSEPCRATAKS
jgi:hypothetical protein